MGNSSASRFDSSAFDRTSLTAIGLCLWLTACGGQTPSTPESAPPEAAEAAASEPSATEAEPGDSGADATASEEPAEDGAAPADNPNEIRDVTYRMTPGGLEIEVDGVMFQPKAEPVKVKGGAWGVKLTMTAEGVGDGPRYILKPKNGVLAFAGSVKRKGAAEEKFGDKRDGEETVELAPGAKLSFETTWPKEGTPLWYGNELMLEAGLWGLGKSAATLRPVRQFFTLRMVAGNKPQPVLQPPQSAQ